MHLQVIITQQNNDLTCTYKTLLHNKFLNSHMSTRHYHKMKCDVNLNSGWGFSPDLALDWKQSRTLVLCLYDSRKSNLPLFRICYL